MAYKAIVTALRNVRPHPNADRVKLATCHGNQIVIGLDNQEDELGLYFNCDGQLSPEFCRANNLYRDPLMNSDPNGKPGMFDNNRRVRAQRFRGQISDGFWMPLDCLEFTKGGYKTLNEGFEFDEFNGIPICSKYINPATEKVARENQGKKTKRAKTSVMFKEHFDTGHFGKSIHEFGPGQLIIITEKVHGCVSYDTIVETLEFGDRKIGELVNERINCRIKAMDTETGEICYVPIDEYYFLPDDGEWFEIELEDGRKIEITGNNPVWLPELRCYRRVDELNGDEILLVDPLIKKAMIF